MLEREAKREKNLETRAKELRLAAKKAEAQASKEKQGDDEEQEEQKLKDVEREFFNLISQVFVLSKVVRFVPRIQDVNLRIVCQPKSG